MTREEAIKGLKVLRKDFSGYKPNEEMFDMAIQALEQGLRKGHWIYTGDYYTGAYETIYYIKCSCCGEDSLEWGDFCPNCGAKMESEGEE